MTSTPSDLLHELKNTAEYSEQERTLLLGLAHSAIAAALRDEAPKMEAPSPHLAEPRGAFTTLHLNGRLRGCVGYVVPLYPLYRTIAETAFAAAFQDNRFPPVTSAEAPMLQIEISVLSPLTAIAPDDVIIGKHGLVASRGSFRGLLLPQVPVEWEWDRETFISQTCRKAGLPADAWKAGATLEAFTAEIFSDPVAAAKD